jgi:hypothetical protein
VKARPHANAGVVQKVLFVGYTVYRQSRASQGFLRFECYPDLKHTIVGQN